MDDGRNTFPSECATDCCTSKPPSGFASKKTFTAVCGLNGKKITKTASATSLISQDDADAKAFNEAQENAIFCLACPSEVARVPVYYNDEQSFTATCPEGYSGTPVAKTVLVYHVGSLVSKDQANASALALATQQAQAELSCSQTIYWNSDQTFVATCEEGMTGTPVSITVPEHTISSAESQAAADAAALQSATEQAQAALSCHPSTYHSTQQTATATCPEGTVGEAVEITVEAGSFTSSISQEDANAQALAAAQAQADSELACSPPCLVGPFTVGWTQSSSLFTDGDGPFNEHNINQPLSFVVSGANPEGEVGGCFYRANSTIPYSYYDGNLEEVVNGNYDVEIILSKDFEMDWQLSITISSLPYGDPISTGGSSATATGSYGSTSVSNVHFNGITVS